MKNLSTLFSRLWPLLLIGVVITPLCVVFAVEGGNPAILENPLASGTTLTSFITSVLKDVVVPIGTVIVVIAIIYCGFLFVMAQGKDAELQKAKTAFLYTVIGAAVLLGAAVISGAVENTIKALRGV